MITNSSMGKEVNVLCECSKKYDGWKKQHLEASKVLQQIVVVPCYYNWLRYIRDYNTCTKSNFTGSE